MKEYADIDGDSGIASFDAGDGYIVVFFKDGSAYEYTNAATEAAHVTQMIALAEVGEGLNSYINRNVRENYSRRLR